MNKPNRINRIISSINLLPDIVRQRILTLSVTKKVPYVGTSLIHIEELTAERVIGRIPNKKRVQNHIHNVHAAAMALLAETVSGFVVAMNLPDDKLPLIKSIHVDYKKRTKGNMRAVATITDDQRKKMNSDPKGSTSIDVHVTDETGDEPIRCEMIWAWVPKKK
jgi:acyl-coenzyme A thioesterase PaaI-like protein